MSQSQADKPFNSFSEFYPYYLSEHQNSSCKGLHLVGSSLVLLILATAIFSQQWLLLAALPIAGYGCAWIGHFVFEKNRPATFKHPLYSFIGDWVMAKDILTGKIPL
ncbi:MAG: Mpo1-like protein [Spongiibacteraceae bacterium]